VTIKQVEVEIADRAIASGWAAPEPPATLTGRSVAVVGSGPAGLAAAQQLTRAGHTVTVYERAEAPGGLLRFGIPEFKLEKRHLDRRLDQMRAEGTRFACGIDAGRDVTAAELRAGHDAVVLAGGATIPRGLPVPGVEPGRRPRHAVAHQRARAARGDHRRRGHRRRLPRHRAPPGRGVGDPA
jgi:glutamate synthase (NADPH/NADH) small chain